MNVNEMHSSKYLKADTMEKPLTLTIDRIKREEMSDGKDKWVMYFLEIKEGLVLNVTNTNTLAEMFGSETDDWDRQKIELFPTKVQYGKDMVPGIRIRAPKRQGGRGRGQGRQAGQAHDPGRGGRDRRAQRN